MDALAFSEREFGSGLNQELSWGSHFKTILNVLSLYLTILDALDAIGDFSNEKGDKNKV